MDIITKVIQVNISSGLYDLIVFGAVEITLKGEVNPVTGMVMNLVDLKECIKLAVMDPLDHRNLVYRVYQFFVYKVPTDFFFGP
jgi:6-pyruvoyl-tetrahydropterin synthase